MGAILTVLIFTGAAATEIFGTYTAWTWLREDGSKWLLIPGLASLILFALLLTRIDASFAGRAFAAYGGVYITGSLVWLWLVEAKQPDRWDLAGGAICVIGAAVIILGPREGLG